MPSELEGLLSGFNFGAALATHDEEHRAQLRAMLIALIEIKDSFDRLFGFLEGKPAPPYLSTVHQIARQTEGLLLSSGVAPFDSIGVPTEPERHEILDVRVVGGMDEGLVLEEVERGYTWDGVLLRKARVIVSGPAADPGKEP